MDKKKKLIVYGLGENYKFVKKYIENNFNVIGYSDSKKTDTLTEGYVCPTEISTYDYDYICITSNKYFQEIKNELINLIGEANSGKIISLYDVFGDFRNDEIRNEWVIKHLKKIPAGQILLDAGAGEQKYKPYCGHLKYIAQDFGEYIPNETKIGLHGDNWDYSGLDIKCDITDIPIENEAVDAILCTEVFEHLKNPMLALKEFSRILRLGGMLILTAPFCCLTHMAPYFFYNGFSEYWYKEHLKDYGFEIKEFIKYGNYFQYMCQELFRLKSMAKRYSGVELNEQEMVVITKSMEIMMRLSEQDRGSDETLRFGSMVVAEKTRTVT